MTRHDTMMLALLALAVVSSCSRCKGTDQTSPPTNTPPPTKVVEQSMSIDQYEDLIYGPGPGTTFAATTSVEHEVLASLVPKMYAASIAAQPADPQQWQAEAAKISFEIQVWTIEGGRYWALFETRTRPRGSGAYVFRIGPKEPGPVILLQAPHNFFDEGTGRLAAELFFKPPPGARPRALFTNTIHRYQFAPGDKAGPRDKRRKNHPADVAHNPEHAFSTATRAFAAAAAVDGGVRVIQLHGFGMRDDEVSDASVAMVVSAGDKGGSSMYSGSVAEQLKGQLDTGVRRFPEEVDFLGATTNAQGRLLKGIEHTEFLHAEMSKELRVRLAANHEQLNMLGKVLFNTAGAYR